MITESNPSSYAIVFISSSASTTSRTITKPGDTIASKVTAPTNMPGPPVWSGIMTLSRGPYSELDKMSLFQDLKLKRRKVDSRCSSDGESVADTSTSSPDLLAPLSPKMCDQSMTTSGTGMSSTASSAATTATTITPPMQNQQQSQQQQQQQQNQNQQHGVNSQHQQQQMLSPSATTTTAISDNCSNVSASTEMRISASATPPTPNNIHTPPTRTTPTPPVQGNGAHSSSNTSTGGGSSRASPDSLEEKPSTTTNVIPSANGTHSNSSSSNNSSGNGTIGSNPSVIRSVKGERVSSPPPKLMNYHQQQHQQQQHQQQQLPPKLPTQSQQHVTVLVTPTRIKTEQPNIQQQQQPPSLQQLQQQHQHQQQQHQHHQQQQQQQHQQPYQPVQSPTGRKQSPPRPYPNCSIGNNVSRHDNGSSTMTISTSPIHQQMQMLHASSQLMSRSPMSPNSLSPPSRMQMSIQSSPQHQQQQQRQQPPQQQMHQQQHHMQQQSVRIKKEDSGMVPGHQGMIDRGIGTANFISMHHRMPQHQQHQQQQQQQQQQHQQHQQQPSGQQMGGGNTGVPQNLMHPTLQLRHPSRDAAILFRVKNEVQQQLPNLMQPNQQRMVWVSNTRINGVKPEVIGGPLTGLRPPGPGQSPSPHHPPSQLSPQGPSQTPPRGTPTVIMGESCGVRTMVWGYEPPPQPLRQSPTTPPSSQTSGSSQNSEEAAQLLLSLGQSRILENRPRPQQFRTPHALNMERLWAGDYSQLPAGQQLHALNLSAQQQWGAGSHGLGRGPDSQNDPTVGVGDDDEQPLVCMICEDKATGLHYGIITCEGCKGFFKRTVQNRRVYTCVADGTCEITKAQRNRCQYCRFKKCIEQGMVLQAVREDRMPGGRNSGAVYNLYKVKYKKHKKQKQQQLQQQQQQQPPQSPHDHQTQPHSQQQQQQSFGGTKIGSSSNSDDIKPMFLNSSQSVSIKHEDNNIQLPSHLVNGTILKTALTNPSEIVHLRHRLDNAVSSSKDRQISYEHSLNMIQTLIDCDAMEDIATLPHFSEFLEDKSEISEKLCNIGDSIVHKLVSWTKKLPFYLEIPVEIHTKLLTDKWHEILILTTAAYQALHGKKQSPGHQPGSNPATQITPVGIPLHKDDPEFVQEVNSHLSILQTCLTTLMGQPIAMEQLKLDVGHMVEKMTQITIMFRRIKLKMEEYVCLKVYILLNKEVELESIQERYVQVLRTFLQHTSPHNPSRLAELLAHIPEIQAAAGLLLESKMFYVPFVLNSANIR